MHRYWVFNEHLHCRFDDLTGDITLQNYEGGPAVDITLADHFRMVLAVNNFLMRDRSKIVAMLAQGGLSVVRPKKRPLKRRMQFWRKDSDGRQNSPLGTMGDGTPEHGEHTG